MEKVTVENLSIAALCIGLPIGIGLLWLAINVSNLSRSVEGIEIVNEPPKVEITPPVRYAENPER